MRYHNYIFLKTNPEFYRLAKSKQTKYKQEFLKKLKTSDEVVVNTFSTLGLKTKTNILLWFQSNSLEAIQDSLNKLIHTNIGQFIKITHTLFGMTRPGQYGSQNEQQNTDYSEKKYLIIYPFSKTQEWYFLSFEKRKELMRGHIVIGKKYPRISQLLLYSYGVDDCEFIVSYDTDDLSDFQRLVMELRSDPVRAYTLKDTPIYTCIYKSKLEILNYL